MKSIALLGSTGSIGKSALSVIARYPDRFRLVAISGHRNSEALLEIAERFKPEAVAITSEVPFPAERWRLYRGPDALVELSENEDYDVLLVATTGLAGALPTIKALERGKRVALANKETLVSFGPLVLEALKKGGELIPVDSEHSALFQLLEGRREEAVRLTITSSGGPFRGMKPKDLKSVKPADALRHPTWSMGPKITVDSATLMNKVLEVIEAHFLFGFPPQDISVIIHPTSTVHALVQLRDGMMLAHMGLPDMRVPIQYALSYPERLSSDVPALDLNGLKLEFHEPDTETFRLLPLAWEALRKGGTAPAVLNASNEVAVLAFLEGRLSFLGIMDTVERVFHEHKPWPVKNHEDVAEADRWAREKAMQGLPT
ncbi:MAG: 1-deoxy-D-xylulose-5-phosphate reductoisomerase [candidate division WOR-3 bacterium]